MSQQLVSNRTSLHRERPQSANNCRRSQSVSKAQPPTSSISFYPASSASSRDQPPPVVPAVRSNSQLRNDRSRSTGGRREHFYTATSSSSYDNNDPDQIARAMLTLRGSELSARSRSNMRPGGNNTEPHRSISRNSRSSAAVSHSSHKQANPNISNRGQQLRHTPTTRREDVASHLSPKSSPEEERAEKYIHQAEQTINGLMQELDDLRFLEEIDNELPSPSKRPEPARSRSEPRPRDTLENVRCNDDNGKHQIPQPVRKTTDTKNYNRHHIPQLIRTASPVLTNNHHGKHAGLAPVPSTSPLTADEPEGPNSRNPKFDPRRISAMDRVALELETQTLCRKVEILEKEKKTLEKAVAMYEVTLQDHENSTRNVAKLESDLNSVRKQLQQAKKDLIAVREQVVADYEDRLQANLVKMQRTQQQADQYQKECDHLRADLDKTRRDFKDLKGKHKEDMAGIRSKLEAKSAELELQLQQVTDLADDLREQLEGEQALVQRLTAKLKEQSEARDNDIRKLKDELKEQRTMSKEQLRSLQDELREKMTQKEDELKRVRNELHEYMVESKDKFESMKEELQNKLMEKEDELMSLRQEMQHLDDLLKDTKESKDEAYEARLSSLQELLSLREDKYNNLRVDNEDMSERVQDQTHQIQQYKNQCSEQTELIAEMTDRLDSVHAEYRQKFSDLKNVYESKEKRRLEEMVESHSAEMDENARRLQAMKEQLQHQNDRHQTQIQQKDIELQQQWEKQKANLKRDVEIEYGQRLHVVEEKLSMMRHDLQEAENEKRRLRHDLEGMPSKEETLRQTKERERQDMLRTNEIKRLQDKTERLLIQLGKKDEELLRLADKLVDDEQSHLTNIDEMRKEHADAFRQQGNDYSEQLKATKAMEDKLRLELDRKNSDMEELRLTMDARVADLLSGLDKAKKGFEAERRRNEDTEGQMRVDLSVLEGKLRLCESTIKEKFDTIIALQQKVSTITEQAVSQSSEFQRERQTLLDEMEALQSHLERKQSTLHSKDQQIQYERECLHKAEVRIHELVRTVAELKDKEQSTQHALSTTEVGLKQERECHQLLASRLSEVDSVLSHLREKEETALQSIEAKDRELKKEQRSHKATSERFIELENKLSKLQEEATAYEQSANAKEIELQIERDSHKSTTDLVRTLQESITHLKDEIDSAQQTISSKDQDLQHERESHKALNAKLCRSESTFSAFREKEESQRLLIEEKDRELQKKLESIKRNANQVHELENTIMQLKEKEASQMQLVASKDEQLKSEQKVIRDTSDRIVELERMVSQSKSEADSARRRVKDLECSLNDMKAEFITERTRHDSSEEQTRIDIAVLQGKLRASEASLIEKRETIDDLEEQLRSIADESSSSTKELQKEVERLRVEVKKINESLESSRAELFTKDDLLKQHQRKLQHNNDSILSLEEIISKHAILEKNNQRCIEDLQLALNHAKDELSSDRTRFEEIERDLTQKLTTAEESIRKVQAHTECQSEEINRLQILLTSERTNFEATEAQARMEISVLEEKNRFNEDAMQEKCDTIDSLERQLLEASEGSSCEIRKLQEEIGRLYRDLETAKQSLAHAQKSLEEKSIEITLLVTEKSDLERAVSRLPELECIVSKATGNETETKAELLEIKRSFVQTQNDFEALSESSKATEDQLRGFVAVLEDKLRKTQHDKTSLQTAVDNLEYQVQQSKRDIEASQGRLEASDKQFRDILSAREDSIRQSLSCTAKLQNTVDDLKYELQQSRREVETLQERSESTESQLRNLIAAKEEKLRESQSDTAALKGSVEDLEHKLQNAYSELESLKEISTTTETQLRGFVSDLEVKLRESQSNATTLQIRVEEVQEDLRQSREEISQIATELQREIAHVEYELQMSNELLKKERAAMDAKVEEYERLKVVNWNLQQKASCVEQLESTIGDLKAALTDAKSNENDRSIEITRLHDQYDSTSENADKIKGLEIELVTERRAKDELRSKVVSMGADLQIKDHQLSRLPVLESQLNELTESKKELQSQLKQVKEELTQSEKLLGVADSEMYEELEEYKKSNDSLKDKLRIVEEELKETVRVMNRENDFLKTKLNEISESGKITNEAQIKIENLTKGFRDLSEKKASLEATIRLVEEDRETRERQINESAEKYSNQILELQMKVEELSKTKESLKTRLSSMEASLDQKEEFISETSIKMSNSVSELQAKLSERVIENEILQAKLAESTAKVLEQPAAKKLKAQLNAESKENRSLKSRIGDVEAELQRKEKQINDIVDRYTREIAHLENALEEEQKVKRKSSNILPSNELAEARISRDQLERSLSAQQRVNASLQKELDDMKIALDKSNNSGNDFSTQKIEELITINQNQSMELERLKAETEISKKRYEKELANVRLNSGVNADNRQLSEKLCEVAKAKAELEERLKKSNAERTEVIMALEEVINEVQSREEEIDTLADILRRRDEELEHAKMIATKALASAQEIKSRFKGKGGERNAELTAKLQELSSNVDFLNKKNDSLQRKTSKMERELKEKEKEVTELRTKVIESEKPKSDSDKLEKFLEASKNKEGFKELTDDDGFPAFQSVCSPTEAGSSLLPMNDTMSTQSADLHGAAGWLHDFDSHSLDSGEDTGSFAGLRTEPSDTQSRRSIERDALRKYVRKRYMQSKSAV